MEQVAQRSCGCPLPGSVQGQAGWGSGQPALVEGVPAHGRAAGTRWSIRYLRNPSHSMILWFQDMQVSPNPLVRDHSQSRMAWELRMGTGTLYTIYFPVLLCFLYWCFHSESSNIKGNKISSHLQIRAILRSCPRIGLNRLNLKEPRNSPASGAKGCVCAYAQVQTASSSPLSSSAFWSCLQSLPCQGCRLRKQCLSPALP